MTDNEYLQTLDLLEGNGDSWGKTATSSKYGITDACINRITRNMITKDSKGNYTPHALKVQGLVSSSLKDTLLNNAEWKDKTLKKQASLAQVGKCKDAWKEMALALRSINKDAIRSRQTIPLSDDMQDRLCLSAHNREGIIKSPKMEKVISEGNEETIRHTAMNYLDHVDPYVLTGIKRRQASIFHPEMSIKEAWEHFDKDGKQNIPFLVDDAYAQDAIINEQRLKDESASQAIASRYGQTDNSMIKTGGKDLPNEKKFISDMIGDSSLAKYSKTSDNGPKTPQEKSLWDSAMDVGQRVVNALKPLFSVSNNQNSNQVANNEQNVLNNNQEVQ